MFLFFSYAEVRAERRRALRFEELSPPGIAPSSVKVTDMGPSMNNQRLFPGQSLCQIQMLSIPLCSRLRSCTWTSAPLWTLRGTERAAHVRFPPTAPGSPPPQQCQTPHVSHPLLPKVLTHSAAGENVQKSCSYIAEHIFYLTERKELSAVAQPFKYFPT